MSAKVSPDDTDHVKEQKPGVLQNAGQGNDGKEPPDVDLPNAPAPIKREESGNKRKSQAAMFGFTDPESIKQTVQERLLKPDPYNVFDYYWDTGYAQWIAKHPVFENVTLSVICLNAVYIGLDTDWNRAGSLTEADWHFQSMEHFFCVYFTWEWICRFLAFKRKRDGLKDAWFVFDSCLVFLMVMETWVITAILALLGREGASPLGGNTAILRLFRLLRLTRLMRMLRSLPELMILIKGMLQAMTSVFYVMCLLIIVTYIFSIAFTQLSVGTETIGPTYFANVGLGMYSLMIYATFLDDLSVLMDDLRHDSWPLVFLALIFIALSAMTVMNMLVGVLCEVVSAVAETEKQEMITQNVIDKMTEVAQRLDTNTNGKISYEEFALVVENSEALVALEEVGVNAVGMVEFAELFFFEDGQPVELPFDKFLEMILDLREDNMCKVKDTLGIWQNVKQSTNQDIADLKTNMDRVDKKIDSNTNRIANRLEEVGSLIHQLASMPQPSHFALAG
jgi:voltage-gated sodium channel